MHMMDIPEEELENKGLWPEDMRPRLYPHDHPILSGGDKVPIQFSTRMDEDANADFVDSISGIRFSPNVGVESNHAKSDFRWANIYGDGMEPTLWTIATHDASRETIDAVYQFALQEAAQLARDNGFNWFAVDPFEGSPYSVLYETNEFPEYDREAAVNDTGRLFVADDISSRSMWWTDVDDEPYL